MSKRKPIDMGALKALAIAQPDAVEAAGEPAPKPDPSPDPAAAKPRGRAASKQAEAAENSGSRQSSRVGKVGIQFWTEPETRKKLKRFALEHDRTLDDVVQQAVKDFLARKV